MNVKLWYTILSTTSITYFFKVCILLFFAILVYHFIKQKNCAMSIAFQEFKSLITSPLGYLILFCFMIILWYLYSGAMERLTDIEHMSPYSIAPLSAFFNNQAISIVFLIIFPTITMKLISEEKSKGTYELLLTCPLQSWEIICGKFFGIFFYYLVLWLPSFFHIFFISQIGILDKGQIVAIYFYLFISGAAFISIGLLSSSLFRSQLAAFITTLLLLLPFNGHIFLKKTNQVRDILFPLYINKQLETICRGTIDLFPFTLFLSITLISLYIATKIIESNLWYPLNIKDFFIEIKKRLAVKISFFISIFLYFIFLYVFQNILNSIVSITLYTLFIVYIAISLYKGSQRMRLIFGINVITSSVSLLIILVIMTYFAYYYRYKIDISESQAFTMDKKAVDLLEKELSYNDCVNVIALIGYSEKHSHEHTQRDNERYFILKEAFCKFTNSLNQPGRTRFKYQFIHPVHDAKNISTYIKKERNKKNQIARLQNKYGVTGYREVIFIYKDNYYILKDHELFQSKLLKSQIPKLLILWHKVYNSGQIIQPPPKDPDQAFDELKKMANPEMLTIFPKPNLDQILVNAFLKVVKPNPNQIYFTQDQGEKTIKGDISNDYQTAYLLADILKRQNFKINTLHLATVKKIPDNCDILVILGTNRNISFNENSIKLLKQYLDEGGKLLITIQPPFKDNKLKNLLKDYGININSGIAARYYYSKDLRRKLKKTTIISVENICKNDNINSFIKDQTIGNSFYPTVIVKNASPVSGMDQKDLHCINFFEVSPMITAQINDKPTLEGPFTLATLIHKKNGFYAAVIGNTEFTSDSPYYSSRMKAPLPYIFIGMNRFIIPALLTYMSPASAPVLIRGTKPIRFKPLKLSEKKRKIFFYSNIILLCIVIIIGIRFWYIDK